jgi:hypothetical protein
MEEAGQLTGAFADELRDWASAVRERQDQIAGPAGIRSSRTSGSRRRSGGSRRKGRASRRRRSGVDEISERERLARAMELGGDALHAFVLETIEMERAAREAAAAERELREAIEQERMQRG